MLALDIQICVEDLQGLYWCVSAAIPTAHHDPDSRTRVHQSKNSMPFKTLAVVGMHRMYWFDCTAVTVLCCSHPPAIDRIAVVHGNHNQAQRSINAIFEVIWCLQSHVCSGQHTGTPPIPLICCRRWSQVGNLRTAQRIESLLIQFLHSFGYLCSSMLGMLSSESLEASCT